MSRGAVSAYVGDELTASTNPPECRDRAALILVVEDNSITRKSVRIALGVEGYRVAEAASGAAAIEAARAEPPDLVLLDLLLPDVRGAELVPQLRVLPGGSEIPILAFSGFVSRMEEARVASAGFTDFILKPIEPSRLVNLVAGYLVPRQSAAPLVAAGRKLLLADDDPVQLKLLRLQFEHAGFRVSTAADGSDALDKARVDRPDLIVTDVLMPNMDGYELCLAVRYDRDLQVTPLVMISANYLDGADRALGERVGANAFLCREEGFPKLLQTALAVLDQSGPPPQIEPDDFDDERYNQMVQQLERQVNLQLACSQRTTAQSAILQELGMISETLSKRRDLESALDEILAYCLDGAGLSKGVLYLTEAHGPLMMRGQFGCTETLEQARSFFGIPEVFQRALRSGDTIVIPSVDVLAMHGAQFLNQSHSRSALIIPLQFGDQDFAVLLLLSAQQDLLEEDWLAFGRALATQIGQSVALSRAFHNLASSEHRYRSLFETANEGICVTDNEGRVIDVNPSASKLFGYPAELLHGIHIGHILAGPDRSRWPVSLIDYKRSGSLQEEFSYLAPSGTVKTLEVRGTRAQPGANLNIVLDISERRHAEQMIHRLAYRDPLTDLPNRVSLQEKLQTALNTPGVKPAVALLLLNLNNFRQINDALGHRNGDELLKQVAIRLKDILSESEMVARLAADEFGAILPHLGPRDIDVVVSKIVDAFKSPFVVAEIPLDIQPSIGIASYPEHGADADTLFQHADLALNTAKVRHHPYAVYNAADDHFSPQQLSLMAELRTAIAQDALVLHYQPKVELSGGEIVGVEALVRWRHPQRGLLPPAEFIPPAEKTGLIDELTRWVTKAALRQSKLWTEAGLSLEMAINVSARNLQDSEFVQHTTDLLAQTACSPQQLVFEITESAIMLDPDGAKNKLNVLRELGIRFAIDDFGTGYSSLSYLKDLPVSQLKIDKAFVSHINDSGSAAIVRSTVELAHNFNLSVVAEGVEDVATAAQLREMGCDAGQGYYFCHPIPSEELEAWLRARAPSKS